MDIQTPVKFYRRRQLAARFSCSETQIYLWEKSGYLPSVRLPGVRAVFYTEEAVERFGRALSAGNLNLALQGAAFDCEALA
jgi:DNA-binding transcriptional MerR regulator